jgi:hypothetical protein
MNDHRTVTPIEHVLRYNGMSQQCCEPGYKYIITETKSKTNNNSYQMQKQKDLKKIDKSKKIKNSAKSKYIDSLEEDIEYQIIENIDLVQNIDDNLCKEAKKLSNTADFPCYSGNKEYLENYFKNTSTDWLWYHGFDHEKFHYENFCNQLWYANCNYKDPTPYTRISMNSYYENNAERVRINIQNMKEGKKFVEHFNGVKEIWHLHKLLYVDIATDISWDPFHTIFNVIKSIVQNWIGKRINLYPLNYVEDNSMHYYLYAKLENNQSIPWIIDEKIRTLIDACVSEILVPSGLSQDFAFKYISMFQQFGKLKSTSVIQIGTVLMKLILTLNENQKKEYRLFYLMLYEDINQLLSPVFKTSNCLVNLSNKILELTCIYQGLFPPSECKLINHQLFCLSKHIENGGSLINFWSVSGERMMKSIKSCTPDGGTKFDYSTIKKFSNYENNKLTSTYSKIENLSDLKFEIKNGIFHLDNYKFCLYNKLGDCVIIDPKINSFLI